MHLDYYNTVVKPVITVFFININNRIKYQCYKFKKIS